MTKQRPIIFNDEGVRAILDGRKTQTRRVVKHDLVANEDICNKDNSYFYVEDEYGDSHHITNFCPYGRVGDHLWVREAFAKHEDESGFGCGYVEYRADKDKDTWTVWSSPIHMPKWRSRILLEITDVRVERLQDISEEDAIKEGIPLAGGGVEGYMDYLSDGRKSQSTFWDLNHPVQAFKSFWGKING